MSIDRAGRLQRVEHALLRHVPAFTSEIWYVSKDGNDGNSGQTPHQAFLTIGAAVDAASAGDAIAVSTGTYDEDGLALSKNGLELWGELGAVLTNAGNGGGTALTVSGNYCRVVNIRATQAGQVGIVVTGYRCRFEDVPSGPGNSIAWNITGNSTRLERCDAGSPTTTGYAIAANGCKMTDCNCNGTGGATRGFYITSGLRGRFVNCTSVSNATAGFHVASGANFHNFVDCASGPGDGDRIDLGLQNMWANFVDRRRREAHEHIYPFSAGGGVAGDPVTVDNTTTNGVGGTREDQNYWGDIQVLIPPDTITTPWFCLGLYIHTETAADTQQWQSLFTDNNHVSAQNGGNAWDKNETILTVADGSIFQTDDLVWVMGNDRTQGEIQEVSSVAVNAVTITRDETTADAQDGLRYNYNVDPSANKMYLVYRPADREFHGYAGDHEMGSTRDSTRIDFCKTKLVFADGAMLIRMLNATDAQASSFDARAIWMD